MNLNHETICCRAFAKRILLLASISVITSIASPARADLLYGVTQTTFPSGGTPVDLMLNVDTDLGKVNFEITGRSDGWFAVGFGNSVMANTYGILALQDGSVEERTLNYSGGSVLTPEVTVLSNTVDGDLRTLLLERDLSVVDTNYYSFPTSETTIALISASAAGGYGYHGADNRSPGSIDLVAVPEPGSIVLLGFATFVVTALRRRRRGANE